MPTTKPRKAAKAPAKKAAGRTASAKKPIASPSKKAAKPAKPTKPTKPRPSAQPEPRSPTTAMPTSEPARDAGWPSGPAPALEPVPAALEPARQGWIPMPTPPDGTPVFDPATGAWLPIDQHGPPAGPAPDDAKRGTVGYVVWTVLLWIDLVLLAGATLLSIVVGAILVFAPESSQADEVREMLTGGTKASLIGNTLLNLLLFGIIPLAWVLGTRRVPVEGTKRFLRLHIHRTHTGSPSLGWTILWGVALAAAMLGAVAILIGSYNALAEQVDWLPNPSDDENPAIQGLLDNLDWGTAILVAVCAGVGEEIFFRGFLQRYLGVWGQAALFGLAHATGGYIPQILFAFGLGIVFGLLIKRGWSLWSLILAHALYDFVLLALALLYPELG